MFQVIFALRNLLDSIWKLRVTATRSIRILAMGLLVLSGFHCFKAPMKDGRRFEKVYLHCDFRYGDTLSIPLVEPNRLIGDSVICLRMADKILIRQRIWLAVSRCKFSFVDQHGNIFEVPIASVVTATGIDETRPYIWEDDFFDDSDSCLVIHGLWKLWGFAPI